MKSILDEAQSLQEELVTYRRYLHQHAEIEFDLPQTVAYVMEQLQKMGLQPVSIGRSGVTVTIGGHKPGKTILLRADMDALPIQEETDLPFKSQTGNMHACGHDLHTAMLLGAAKLLKAHENDLQGNVKLIFQPNEEALEGAKNMIEAGILENPQVDAAMMIHVQTGLPMPLPSGFVMVMGSGPTLASADWFTITVQGRGGHGGNPHYTVDPLNVICHIYMALQSLIARETPALDPAVLTVGELHGGNASNVIPDNAYMQGTIRAFSKDNREFIKKRLEEISMGVAATFRASVTVDYNGQCPCLVIDENLSNQVTQYSADLLGSDKIINLGTIAGGVFAKNTGSEDFAFVSDLVPTAAIYIAAGNASEGKPYSNHHPQATFAEEPLGIGAAIYANAAIRWLENN